jgi:hypothetical protein
MLQIIQWVSYILGVLLNVFTIFQMVLAFISQIFNQNKVVSSLLFTGGSSFLLAGEAIKHPEGAINAGLINLVDVLIQILPDTPPGMEFDNMFFQMVVDYPLFAPFIYQAFSGAMLVLIFFGGIKAIKLLPFI